jgi:Raf kinase inhibitor-like YbhB/YbcL family protein
LHPCPFTALPDATALPPNTHEGLNSMNATGYHGPCPPSGKHHYVFTLYALDAMLNIASAPTTTQLRTAMESHVLGQATLTGLREKPKPDIASRPK